MWKRSRALHSAIALLVIALASRSRATTRYYVRLNTSEFAGQAKALAFDYISGDTIPNTANILKFAHDGQLGRVLWNDGPVSGGLAFGRQPADASIQNRGFENRLLVPFDAIGTHADYTLSLSENAGLGTLVHDEFAFYFLNGDGSIAFATTDPLGTAALFSVDVTGAAGGDLSVFAPMQFLPPDSLVLNNSLASVADLAQPAGHLRFTEVSPNPTKRGIRISYAVPAPGGWLAVKIYDVAGRLVATPFGGTRPAGIWTNVWNGSGSRGAITPAGVYLVQIKMAGQSVVRRVVVAR